MGTNFKLTQPQHARLPRLLHMEYTPRELAEELGTTKRHIEGALEAGCPQRRTEARVWIVGDAFAAWYHRIIQERKVPLGPDEAFCVRCRKAVLLAAPTAAPLKTGAERLSGICPNCGAQVNRFRRVA